MKKRRTPIKGPSGARGLVPALFDSFRRRPEAATEPGTVPSSPSPALSPEQGVDAVIIERAPFYRLLVELGTEAWRLERKMVDKSTGEPLEEMRRAYRHASAISELLKEFGVDVKDHTGEQIPENGILSVNKIAFEPTPGIERETVIETVRPSVFLGSHVLKMADVVVGIPVENQSAESADGEVEGEKA